MHWPVKFGGGGLDPLVTFAVEEQMGYHWLPMSSYLLSVKTIGNALLQYATEEMCAAFIPRIASGELIFCQGFSEPEAGTDLGSLRTAAVRDGDRFMVNGRKIWTSSAEHADWVYLAVRTGTRRYQHRGLSVFLVDINTPGIVVDVHQTLGGGTIGELTLTDVAVPADQVVGEIDGGWQILMGTLDYERVTSEKVGVMLRLLDELKPLVADRSGRQTLARIRGDVHIAREHGGARHRTAGRRPGRQCGVVDGEAFDRPVDAGARCHRRRPGRTARAGRAQPRSGAGRQARGVRPRRGSDDHCRRSVGHPAQEHLPPADRNPVMTERLPLEGLRVLDYAQYVAGPFAAMLLADLGAEVIKVEPPRGDAWRHYEPVTADGGKWFLSLNRNKKSVVADLKTVAGH